MCYIKEITNDSGSQSIVSRVCFSLLVLFGNMFFSGAKAQTVKQAKSHHATAQSPAKAHGKANKPIRRLLVAKLPSPMHWIVSGYVVNERRQPVPFASVRLANNAGGGLTDSNGHFEIGMFSTADSATILLSSAGFLTSQVVVYPADSTCVEMGTVVLSTPPLEKPSGNELAYLTGRLVCLAFDTRLFEFPRVASGCKDWFWVREVKAFPNPISLNAGFNLRLAPARLGEYIVQVTDAEGKTVVEKFVDIRTPFQLEHFDAGQFEDSGEYLVSLIARCDGAVYSNRLVVQ